MCPVKYQHGREVGIDKTFLPHMSSLEAREAIARGAIALLPIGTVEGNGPQMPMGYDYLVSEAVAKRVAERTGDIWMPPITYGVSGVLDAFPGTVAIPASVLEAQIEHILRSLIKHGFERIVLINNHIPNQAPAEAAIRRVRADTGVLAAAIYPGALATALTADLFEGETGTIGHGAEPGTSLMLHLTPDAMRMDLARKGTIKRWQGFEVVTPFASKHEGATVNLYLELDELTDYGGWADPSTANAERGAEIMRRIVDYVVSFLERFRTIDTRARGGIGIDVSEPGPVKRMEGAA